MGHDSMVSRRVMLAPKISPFHRKSLYRKSPGATTAPEGEDHVKVQASLGGKRNLLLPLTHLGLSQPLGLYQLR